MEIMKLDLFMRRIKEGPKTCFSKNDHESLIKTCFTPILREVVHILGFLYFLSISGLHIIKDAIRRDSQKFCSLVRTTGLAVIR